MLNAGLKSRMDAAGMQLPPSSQSLSRQTCLHTIDLHHLYWNLPDVLVPVLLETAIPVLILSILGPGE